MITGLQTPAPPDSLHFCLTIVLSSQLGVTIIPPSLPLFSPVHDPIQHNTNPISHNTIASPPLSYASFAPNYLYTPIYDMSCTTCLPPKTTSSCMALHCTPLSHTSPPRNSTVQLATASYQTVRAAGKLLGTTIPRVRLALHKHHTYLLTCLLACYPPALNPRR